MTAAAVPIESVKLDGLVPPALAPQGFRIFLQDMELPVDIGFHDFEIGNPQRLMVSVDVHVSADHFAAVDDPHLAWNYDFVHSEILRLVAGGRFNLQETLVRAIYELIASRAGVTGLTVSSRKLDVYPDCAGVGVEISSF